MTSIQIDIKDGLSSSVAIKGPCRVATTANITLVGEQTIDGVAVITDDRVLVKNQTTASENGIYIADTGNWRRSKDFNKTKDVKTGTTVVVISGTVGAGWWQISTTGDITIGTTNIAFAQVVQPFDADLASWAGVTRAAGFDTFAATPSSANLKALVTDETGSGATVFADTPQLVTPWIDYATGRSVVLAKSINGVFSSSARYESNSMTIATDTVDMGLDGGKVDGLTVNHLFGGAGTRGGRHGVDAFCVLTDATASDNPDRSYVGGAFTGWAIASDGGGVGTEKGAIFGINPQGVLANGATNFNNVTGGEVNVAINTGASSKIKSGLSICNRSDDAVKGSLYDGLLQLSNQTGTVRWDYGILFGPMNGAHPVDTTGTIIGTTGTATVANGIDFGSYTFTSSVINAPGFFVGPSGHVELGLASSVNTPFIDFHSSGNVVDYDVRMLVSGGTAVAGNGTMSITGGVSVSAFMQAGQIIPTSSSVPSNGLYLPAANTLGWAVSTTAKMQLAGSALSPAASDGTALGTTALQWSDLFLASGGVVNWANGNYTVTHSSGTLTFSGAVLSSGAGGIGYATGAGGIVTQATSKSTGVTLNKLCGSITMNNAALAADTTVQFTLTNSTIAAGDLIILNQLSGGTLNGYILNGACSAGSAIIYVRNASAGSLSDTPVIAFAVIKGVTA